MKALLIDNFDSFTFNLEHCFRLAGCEVETYRNNVEISIVEKIRPDFIIIGPGPSSPQNAGISMPVVESYSGKIPIFGVCLGMEVIAEVYGMKIRPLDDIIRGKIDGLPISPVGNFHGNDFSRGQNKSDIVHGAASEIRHDSRTIYDGLPQPFFAGRYHSLGAYTFVDPTGPINGSTVHDPLEIVAVALSLNSPTQRHFPLYTYGAFETPPDRHSSIVMGIRHNQFPVEGVQFHPESVLSMKENAGQNLVQNVVNYFGSLK